MVCGFVIQAIACEYCLVVTYRIVYYISRILALQVVPLHCAHSYALPLLGSPTRVDIAHGDHQRRDCEGFRITRAI